jgi:hypothetical protein
VLQGSPAALHYNGLDATVRRADADSDAVR